VNLNFPSGIFFGSEDDRLHHIRFLHPGQAEIQPLRSIGKAFVIHSEQVQDRCVKIAHMHGILNNVVAEIVRFAVDRAALCQRSVKMYHLRSN
jgi:hypothetical protein